MIQVRVTENHTENLRFFGLNDKGSQHLCSNTGICSRYESESQYDQLSL